MTDSIEKQVEPNPGKPEAASNLKLVPITTREEFSSLTQEWCQLITQMQTPSPFLTWDYLDVWWSVYGETGYDVHLFIVRNKSGKLVGAIPLTVTQRNTFRGTIGRFRHVAFIAGIGEMIGESIELPALPGHERAVGEMAARVIAEDLKTMWHALYLHYVPEQSISTHAMIDRLNQLGVSIQKIKSLSSPYLRTDQCSWDDYLASKSKNFRKNIRQSMSYAEKHCHMKILRVGDDVSMEVAMDHLIRLEKVRWGNEIQAFGTPRFIDFHKKLAPRFYQKGMLDFFLIELNGEIAGAAYDFVYADKWWGYQAPWDKAFQKASPGLLLNIISLKSVFDRSLQEFDLLPGDTNYKNRWTDSEHILHVYEAASPWKFAGYIYAGIRKLQKMLVKIRTD